MCHVSVSQARIQVIVLNGQVERLARKEPPSIQVPGEREIIPVQGVRANVETLGCFLHAQQNVVLESLLRSGGCTQLSRTPDFFEVAEESWQLLGLEFLRELQ